jgi:hypothetical protein
MAKIIKSTDFVGKYAISQNSLGSNVLNAFIEKYEKQYLYDLLGKELAELFLSDITTPFTPPDTQIYLDIFNPLTVDYYTEELNSNGIKEMLLGFIYFEFVRTQTVKNTLTGNVIGQNEVSLQAEWNSTNIYLNYNEGVKTYRVIQIYVEQNSAIYPTYKGKFKSLNNWYV